MKKRGSWYLEEVGKIVIVAAIIVFLLAFIIAAREKIITSFTEFFRGGLL